MQFFVLIFEANGTFISFAQFEVKVVFALGLLHPLLSRFSQTNAGFFFLRIRVFVRL